MDAILQDDTIMCTRAGRVAFMIMLADLSSPKVMLYYLQSSCVGLMMSLNQFPILIFE